MKISTLTMKITIKKRWYPLIFVLNIPYFITGRFSCLPAFMVDISLVDGVCSPIDERNPSVIDRCGDGVSAGYYVNVEKIDNPYTKG